jgi:hypothetical protein
VASPPPTAPGGRRRTRLLVAAAVAGLGVGLALVLSLLLTGGGSRQSTKPTIAITTDSIQRIDPSTNRLVATIPVGSSVGLQAGYQVAVGGGAVRVDVRTGRVIATIDVGPNPSDIAVGEGAVWVAGHPAIS